MIVPMKKVLLLALESEAHSALEELRNAGVMQIDSAAQSSNAALLIALGLVGVNYADWVRFSWKFQGLNLILTSLLLLLGMSVGY